MRRVKVELIVDSTGAVRGVESYSKSVRVASQETKRAGKSVVDFGKVFNVALGNIAARAAEVAFRALSKVGDVVKEGIKLAREQEKVNNKLTQSLKNLGDTSEASFKKLKTVAAEQQNLTGISNEVIENAQAMLLTFQEVGGAEGAELLTSRLADVAVGVSGVGTEITDLNNVAALFGRALTGSAASLRRVGISMSEVQEESFNAAEGLDRVRLLAEIIDSNVKGLAAAAADPFKIMSEAADDAKKAIGEELLPDLKEVAEEITAFLQDPETIEGLRDLAGAARDFVSWIRAVQKADLPGELVKIQMWGDKVGAALAWVIPGLKQLRDFNKESRRDEFLSNFKKQFPFLKASGSASDDPLINPPPVVPPGGLGGGSGAEEASKAREEAEKARRAILDEEFKTRSLQLEAMEEGRDKIVRAIGLEFDQRREAYRRSFGELGQEIDDLFTTLERQSIEAASDSADVIEDEIGDLGEELEPSFEELRKMFEAGLFESISEADDALELLQAAFDEASTDEARAQIGLLIDALNVLRGEMATTAEASIDIGPAIERGLGDAASAFAETVGSFAAGEGTLGDVAGSILLTLSDLAVKVGKLLIGFGVAGLGLRSIITNPVLAIGAGAALVALGSFARTTISRAISSETGSSSSTDSGGRVVSTGIGEDIVRVPGRAFGGHVTGGMPFMVGERGPELFVPRHSGSIIPEGGFAFAGDRSSRPGGGTTGRTSRMEEFLRDLAENGLSINGETRIEGDTVVISYDTAKDRRERTIGG